MISRGDVNALNPGADDRLGPLTASRCIALSTGLSPAVRFHAVFSRGPGLVGKEPRQELAEAVSVPPAPVKPLRPINQEMGRSCSSGFMFSCPRG